MLNKKYVRIYECFLVFTLMMYFYPLWPFSLFINFAPQMFLFYILLKFRINKLLFFVMLLYLKESAYVERDLNKILFFNVNYKNKKNDLVHKLITKEEYLFSGLVEVGNNLRKEIENLKDYKTCYEYIRNIHMCLISSYKLHVNSYYNKILDATLDTPKGSKRIFLVHFSSPITYSLNESRDNQIKNLTELVLKKNPDFILGDFNSSYWYPIFRKFLKKTSYFNPREKEGLNNSWPSIGTSFGVGIDHILTKKKYNHIKFSIGEFSYSDHLPILLEFNL